MMEPESTDTVIRAAYPTIALPELERAISPLSTSDTLATLLDAPGYENYFQRLATLLLERPEISLREALPGLGLAEGDRIPFSVLPSRVMNAFEKLNHETWADVLDISPADLFKLRNLGERSVHLFLANAVRTSAEAIRRTRSPLPQFQPADRPQTQASSGPIQLVAHQIGQLVRWARFESDSLTLGELLSLIDRCQLPLEIAAVWDGLCELRLEALSGDGQADESMDLLLDELLGRLHERDCHVFFRRIPLNAIPTLNDLGEEFGLTRERVRQLELRAETEIRQAITEERFAPVQWRAHTLRGLLGSAVPRDSDLFHEAIARVTRDIREDIREIARDLFLWLAGPYERDAATGWIANTEVPGAETANGFLDAEGHVDLAGLKSFLSRRRIVPAIHQDWLEHIARVRVIEGHTYLWSGSVTDKAAILLRLWGRPATAEELVAAIGDGHNVRATRSRLFEDSRFSRVDMDRVALRAWGLEEYSGIAEEIGQEIDRRGGNADVEDLVATLVRQFSLREQSVRAFLSVPMFVVDGRTIRRRAETDSFEPPPPITDVPACYVLSPDSLTWRIEVNSDLLRGSGRPMPSSLAAWLGVSPGGKRVFSGEVAHLTVSWPPTSVTGPSMGSIRPFLESARCSLGDLVLLRFHREEETLQLTRLISSALDSVEGLEKLSMLTGIALEGDVSDFLLDLGWAVGVHGTSASMQAALRGRGESDLAKLIPDEACSDDLDSAIEGLSKLL